MMTTGEYPPLAISYMHVYSIIIIPRQKQLVGFGMDVTDLAHQMAQDILEHYNQGTHCRRHVTIDYIHKPWKAPSTQQQPYLLWSLEIWAQYL
jgi:hypothetical protein